MKLNPLFVVSEAIELVCRLGRACLSRRWRFKVMAALGIASGMALLAFSASNAASYLSDRPEACINCHIMVPFYATWQRSSHASAAVCNDCHVPQDSKLRGLFFKAMDGARHAWVFTIRGEPQVFRLNQAAVPVVQKNCVRCHEHQIMRTDMGSSSSKRLCWECHRYTPHDRAMGLSSVPHVRRPALPTAGIPRLKQGRPEVKKND